MTVSYDIYFSLPLFPILNWEVVYWDHLVCLSVCPVWIFFFVLMVKKKKKKETRMSASILKQDPNTQKVKKNTYLIWQYAVYKFSG